MRLGALAKRMDRIDENAIRMYLRMRGREMKQYWRGLSGSREYTPITDEMEKHDERTESQKVRMRLELLKEAFGIRPSIEEAYERWSGEMEKVAHVAEVLNKADAGDAAAQAEYDANLEEYDAFQIRYGKMTPGQIQDIRDEIDKMHDLIFGVRKEGKREFETPPLEESVRDCLAWKLDLMAGVIDVPTGETWSEHYWREYGRTQLHAQDIALTMWGFDPGRFHERGENVGFRLDKLWRKVQGKKTEVTRGPIGMSLATMVPKVPDIFHILGSEHPEIR
jgi:hypothetical protein